MNYYKKLLTSPSIRPVVKINKLYSLQKFYFSSSSSANYNDSYNGYNSQGLYGSTEVLNKDLFSDDIPTVELNYDVLKFEEKDSNDRESPLIVLHGLFGSKVSNRSMNKFLLTGLKRNIYSLDLRNHGASPHISRHDYPSMANDVEKWVQKQNFTHKPIIIGHSMGAKVAMSCVLRKPNMFAGMCAIDNVPVATIPSPNFPKYVKKLLEIVNDPEVTTSKQCLSILHNVEKNLMVKQFLMTTLIKQKDESTGKYRFQPKVNLTVLNDAIVKGNIANWEFNPLSNRWSGPSLFIRGTNSQFCSDETFADISKFFPNFESRNVEGSHWVNAENPEGCADAIIDFVERFEDK